MEEVEDFFEWAKKITIPEVKYFAVYEPETGKIKKVSPDFSCVDDDYKIEISNDVALSILERKTSLRSYRVDVIEGKLEFVEIRSLNKIDDILHRIIEDKWSSVDENDFYVIVNRRQSTITFSLDEKYKNKKMLYDGSTKLQFFLTDYNDPNIWFHTFVFNINDIKSKDQTYHYVLPKKFSFYTRRIFKNYVYSEI